MILVPPMWMDAVDHPLHVCLLALSSPLHVASSPSPHPSCNSLFQFLSAYLYSLLLHLREELGSVGPACGILSGSSSCACQFSPYSFTLTHLRSDLYLPPSSQLHLLDPSHTANPTLPNGTLHNLISIFRRFKKKKIPPQKKLSS